jgi:glycosyltransferase involved in cell wall biosynthesis
MSFIVSICIPTFNRSLNINNLLQQLHELVKVNRHDIEICISDNCSTDDTSEVIKKWDSLFTINSIRQPYNKGGTANVKEVVKLAKGKYTLLIGDDDGIDVNQFSSLIEQLKIEEDFFWNIGISKNDNSKDCFNLSNVGTYDKIQFSTILEKKGLISLGFIGKHIVPTFLVQKMSELETDKIIPWPHLHLFFSTYNCLPTRIVPFSFYNQAVHGTQLYWDSKEGLEIILAFQKIFSSEYINSDYKPLRLKEVTRFYLFLGFLKHFLLDTKDFRSFAVLNFRKVLKPGDNYKLKIIIFIKTLEFLSLTSPILSPTFKYLNVVKKHKKIKTANPEKFAFKRGI